MWTLGHVNRVTFKALMPHATLLIDSFSILIRPESDVNSCMGHTTHQPLLPGPDSVQYNEQPQKILGLQHAVSPCCETICMHLPVEINHEFAFEEQMSELLDKEHKEARPAVKAQMWTGARSAGPLSLWAVELVFPHPQSRMLHKVTLSEPPLLTHTMQFFCKSF
jgi:hypothetical protein